MCNSSLQHLHSKLLFENELCKKKVFIFQSATVGNMSLMIAINGLSLIERTLQYYLTKIVAINLKAIQN